MIINYLKTAWRNMKKHKGFFALNFVGLYISVLCCLLIALIILHETSFDKRSNNNLNIYRVVESSVSANGKTYSPVTQYPLARACLLYTSPSPRDRQKSRMPSSA